VVAVAVLFVREAMRLMIGLGSFLLGVAGLFLYFGLPFLATAQVFVYVGGVLRPHGVRRPWLVHRQADDRPVLEYGTTSVRRRALAVTVTIVACLRSVVGDALPTPGVYSGVLANELLGPKLLVFEMAGALLLTGLVAVLTYPRGGGSLMAALMLCASLFGAGLYVVMTRREIIGLLTGVEMMLGAANVQLVMLGAAVGGTGATIEAAGLMVLVVAAAEAAGGTGSSSRPLQAQRPEPHR